MTHSFKTTLQALSWIIVAFLLGSVLILLEPPHGSLIGQVTTTDLTPMDNAIVYLDAYPDNRSARTDSEGKFRFDNLPVNKKYYLRADARGYEYRYLPGNYEVQEGKETNMGPILLEERKPNLQMTLWDTVKTPDQKVRVGIRGNKVRTIQFQAYQVDPSVVLKSGKDIHALEENTQIPSKIDGLTLVKEWTEEIPAEDVIEFDRKVLVPVEGTGLFLIHAQANSTDRTIVFIQNTLVNKTNLGFIAKRDANKLLLYASSFKQAHPLSGVKFNLFFPSGTMIEGSSNAQGIAEFSLPAEEYPENPWILATGEQSVAYLEAPSEVDEESYYGEPEGDDETDPAIIDAYRDARIFLYTDRPIYRPAQKVYFKGIVRKETESGGYVLMVPSTSEPSEEEHSPVQSAVTVHVRIENPLGDTLYEADLPTNAYGSFWSEFELGEDPELGYYGLIATLPGKEYRIDFSVEEYRKPEFKVEVRADKPRYYEDEKIVFLIDVQYYFGAPVDAEIEYSLYKSPYQYPDPDDPYPSYSYHDDADAYAGGYGEFIEEGKLKTDANGHAVFTYTPPSGDENTRYTLRVTAKDMTEKIVSREGDAYLVGGDFFFRTRRQEFLAFPKKEFPLVVVTKDYEGKPVSREFELRIEREYWDNDVGTYSYSKLEKLSGKTDAQGVGRVSLNFPGGGYYRLDFSGKDSAGRTVHYEDYLWVAGRTEDQNGYGLDRGFIVIPEKTNYNAGDVAKMLVVDSEKDSHILVSVEGSRLHEYRVEKLDGFSKVLEIPLKKEWTPNVFVSVSRISDKTLSEESIELNVNPMDHFLNVAIQPYPESFEPGEEVSYLVTTTNNSNGQPVPAEVSLGVVDESIYALRADSTDIKKFFWGPKPNRVGSNSSFDGYYSGGIEKEDRNLLRRNFKDTAYWIPSIVTDEQGQAAVKFKLPDNLTTWRATVVASTSNTDVGQQTNQVISSKPLIVRLATPRFFMQRDVLTLKAVIHNYTDKDQTLNVSLGVSGIDLQNPQDDKPRTITVQSKQTASFEFTVLSKFPGEATLQLLAKNDQVNDGLEIKIPILAHGIEEHHFAQGEVPGAQPGGESRRTADLMLPSSTVPEASNLKITLDANFIAQLLGSLAYLVDYPYGCVEQTTSRILPAVAVSHLYQSLGLTDPMIEKRLPKVIEKGIKRLVRFQHEDGGWGWWASDESDPYMTSYAMYGLLRIQSLGKSVPEQTINKGKEALEKQLKEGMQSNRAESPYGKEIPYFIHYVASLAGIPNNPPLPGDKPLPSRMAQAFLILALEAQHKHEQALPILNDLERAAICKDGFCRFSNGANSYRGDGEVTGWALHALISGGSTNQVLKDSIVKWLLSVRQGDMWRHTQETASILTGMTEYARDLQGTKSGVHAKLTLNEKELEKIQITSPHFVQTFLHPELNVGKNHLGIFNFLPTTLYYQADLKYFTQEEDLQPVANGIQVKREYVRLTSEVQNGERIYKTSEINGKIKRGEMIGVRVTLTNSEALSYVVIEDPLPSGFEVQKDISFDSNTSYFSEMTVRDEMVALFDNYLAPGTHVFNYVIRPELPGQFHVMPSHSYEMYRPEISGMGAEARLEVE